MPAVSTSPKSAHVLFLSLAVALAAAPSPVRAQPHAPAPPPDAAAVEQWLRRACGVGQNPDAAWGAAHVRLPVTVDECAGESRRRCRHRSERDAAAALRLACEADVVDSLRRGDRFADWSAGLDGRRFVARGSQRRVVANIGQFQRALVLVTDAAHEATLAAVDDR